MPFLAQLLQLILTQLVIGQQVYLKYRYAVVAKKGYDLQHILFGIVKTGYEGHADIYLCASPAKLCKIVQYELVADAGVGPVNVVVYGLYVV